MGVARGLLGGLVEMSGDLFQNARKVVLPDGTKITVWFAGAVAHIGVEVAAAAKKLAGSKVFVVVIDALWPEPAGDFDGKKHYTGENCSVGFEKTPAESVGRLDWVDHSGKPQLWIRNISVSGRARYDGAEDYTDYNNRKIYKRTGEVIETLYKVNGITSLDGIVYYVTIGAGQIKLYTSKDELVYSVTSVASYATDKWFKFNASGNTGVLLYSTHRYFYITIVHDENLNPSVTSGFVYPQKSRRFKVETVFKWSPYLIGGCFEGFGLAIVDGISGGQVIRAVDFVGDSLHALYIATVTETKHADADLGSVSPSWYDNVVRAATTAKAYYIRDINSSTAVDINLSGSLHTSRMRLNVRKAVYDFFSVPVSHYHWSEPRILDLDIRKKACVIWSDPLFGGSHMYYTHNRDIIAAFNNDVLDTFTIDEGDSYVTSLPFVVDSQSDVSIDSWECGSPPPFDDYIELEEYSEITNLSDIVVEDGYRGRLLSWESDNAFVMCRNEVPDEVNGYNVENRFLCSGVSYNINSILPNVPTDYGYAVIDKGDS